MMHYRKGENVEKEITKDDLPFGDCLPKGQQDFLWMHVKGGTKVTNVISYAKNALDKNEFRTVIWSGSGGGVVKTISCAEILKRDYPLYQVTRICYTTVEEHWKPQMDGLEEIVANRQIPCIHILMSFDAIDDSIEGLQKPNTKTDFWVHNNSSAATALSQNRDNNGQRQQRTGQNRRPRQFKPAHQKQSQQYEPQEEQQNIPQQQEQQQQQGNQKRSKPRNRSPNNQQKPQQRQHKPPQRQVAQDANKSRETADVRKAETKET